MVTDPDRALLDAWKTGDGKAGDALVRRHFDSVRNFFRNKAPAAECEDLIQLTFMGCQTGIGNFRGESLFRTYLFKVARNTLADHFRKKGHQEEDVLSHISVADADPTPSSILSRRTENKALVHALRQIPVDDQIVLELYYWEELPAREIAEVVGLSEGGVRGRIKRAKDGLKKALNRMELTKEQLQSTLDNMDAWLESVRKQLAEEAAGGEHGGEQGD